MNEEHQLTPSQKLEYPTDELRTPINMANSKDTKIRRYINKKYANANNVYSIL